MMAAETSEAAVWPEERSTTQKLRALFRARGYWKDDRPDVGRFCREKGYLPQSVYAWLRGAKPRHEALRRLAADLSCDVGWLISGEGLPADLEAAAQAGGKPAALPAQPVPAARGKRKGTPLGPVFDAEPIARLRELAEKLERLEAGLQAFFDVYPDLLLWLDRDGTVAGATQGRGWEPMLPLQRQIGKRPWDLLPGEAARAWRSAFIRVRETGRPLIFEIHLKVKGAMRAREVRLVPVRGHGYLAIVRDVTQLREPARQARPPKGKPAPQKDKK